MNSRPLYLKGNIKINNEDEYIIGKIIKNSNVEEKYNFIQVLTKDNMSFFQEGYKGYIFEEFPGSLKSIGGNFCYDVKDINTLINYDVVEIVNNRYIKVLYRDDSEDNIILTTNQCNSNCIMCPDSDGVRKTKFNPSINKLLEQVECIPNDTAHITITGGEPGMLKDDFILLLNKCKQCLPNTEFLLLTNGRIFSSIEYTTKFLKNAPSKIRVGIPLYADNRELHDSITRVEGSFEQTVVGIKRLLKNNIDVEIRIVVLKKNYKELENITKFIIREMPSIKYLNIMALEMSGNAYINKKEVWVGFEEVRPYLNEACLIAVNAGITTNLYNFPLCFIDRKLYSLCKKSITDYKIRYKEECENCILKHNCGGFFNSTINEKNIIVNPIMEN